MTRGIIQVSPEPSGSGDAHLHFKGISDVGDCAQLP